MNLLVLVFLRAEALQAATLQRAAQVGKDQEEEEDEQWSHQLSERDESDHQTIAKLVRAIESRPLDLYKDAKVLLLVCCCCCCCLTIY